MPVAVVKKEEDQTKEDTDEKEKEEKEERSDAEGDDDSIADEDEKQLLQRSDGDESDEVRSRCFLLSNAQWRVALTLATIEEIPIDKLYCCD